MLKMTKKVKKNTLYRLFFEICSVTNFFKSPVYSVTKPSVPPPPLNSIPDFLLSFPKRYNVRTLVSASSELLVKHIEQVKSIVELSKIHLLLSQGTPQTFPTVNE